MAVPVDAVPVAHTPPGGYGEEMPPPILGSCAEPLVAGAPDLRGTWVAVSAEVGGEVVAEHPVLGATQRIEQARDRLVVTAAGVIHDMRCDGTEANGVHDVMQTDFVTTITVVAAYEDGVHVLRPVGLPIEVRRWLDGEQMVWDYASAFTARLDRMGGSDG
jgi:hypothetical protein